MNDFEAADAAVRIFNRLGQARANNGDKLSKDEWLRITANHIKAEVQAALNAPKKKRVKGDRNPLFDMLATSCGINLSEMSKPAAKLIGVALADIQSVMKDLTPEEIDRRVKIFKRKYTQPGNLTPKAIAKHWAAIGGGVNADETEKTREAKFDIYQEPKDWEPAAAKVYGPATAALMIERGWFDLSPDYRSAILKEFNK